MNSANSTPNVPRTHETTIRVRYQETDAQGRVHHANYINYFEIGRVELLRSSGYSYRQLEQSGIMLVVTDLQCKYFLPAVYDDLLLIRTTVSQAKGVRVHHEYRITRDDDLIVQGHSTVACLNQDGKPCKLPEWLRIDKEAKHSG